MNSRWLRAIFHLQFLTYIAVGVLTTLVDVGAMSMLMRVGANVQLATTSGFVLGLLVNFLLHTRITFATQVGWLSTFRFWGIVAVNYGLTLVFVMAAQWLGFSAIEGKLASLPVVAVNGFLLGKFWAFR
jgi:putative flippase GtrA